MARRSGVRQQITFGRQIATTGLPARLPGFGHVGRREGFVIDGPHQNLAKPCRDRRQVGLDTLRKTLARLGHPFSDLLSGEVDVRLIGENDGDLAEAVATQGAGRGEAGNACHGRFKGIGDLSFDLFGRQRRRDGGDLNLPVGDVGHGVDRELRQFEQAKRGDERRNKDDEPSEADGSLDESFEHDQCVLVAMLGFALGQFGLEQEGIRAGDPVGR